MSITLATPIPARQVVAAAERARALVEATASAPHSGFEAVRERLLSILGTIEIVD